MNLRTRLAQLSNTNPALRPHLEPILASSTDMVSRVREFFDRDEFLASATKVVYRVSKKAEDEIDATTVEDKWSGGGHYTVSGGGYLRFTYPSRVAAMVTVEVTDLPYESDKHHIERVVRNLLEAHARSEFQEDLDNDGQLHDFLNDAVDVRGGTVSRIRWQVRKADLYTIDVQVRGEEAAVRVGVFLDIDADTSDVDVELDGPDDYDDGRYASLRAQVVKLAYTNPALRPHLLPLVK